MKLFKTFSTRISLIELLCCSLSVLLIQCATGGNKPVGGRGPAAGDSNKATTKSKEIDSSDRGVGQTFVHSLSNNAMTSKVVSRANAAQLTSKLSSSAKGLDAKAKNALVSMISAQRLAAKPFSAILSDARQLADIELKAGVSHDLPEVVKLELALAALQSKDFGMFDFLILPLTTSKHRKIKAAALNALGVITLMEDRVPEAAEYFKDALKVVSDYEAAMLNLGFLSLKYGDLSTAKRMLARVHNDWFSESAKLIIARQNGENEEAGRLCKKLMGGKEHKPTIFNCGLFEWLGKKNIKQAKILINKALKLRGGSPEWDQQGYATLNQMRGE
ncbi:MAG: hypothetical protein R3B45_06860 [Bdellovibrionota bacterium]